MSSLIGSEYSVLTAYIYFEDRQKGYSEGRYGGIWRHLSRGESFFSMQKMQMNSREEYRGVEGSERMEMDGGGYQRSTEWHVEGEKVKADKKKGKKEERICTKGVGWSLVHEDWLWKATIPSSFLTTHPRSLLSLPHTPAPALGNSMHYFVLHFFFLLISSPCYYLFNYVQAINSYFFQH